MSVSALQIAIDVMSGDCGPSVCVPAALAAAREFPDVRFTLIGARAELDAQLAAAKLANVDCIFTTQVVEMTDHPREALRRKKDSSMRRALDLVKAHEAHACVSAGNTGRSHGDGALRAEDAAGRRAAGHRLAHPLACGPHLYARSRRERLVHARRTCASSR